MSYKHFNITDRICIGEYLNMEYSICKIANLMKRSKSSISEEIKKYSLPIQGYVPRIAQEMADKKRRNSKWDNQIKPELKEYIKDNIKATWSPEQISNRLKKDFRNDKSMRISFKTIYTLIYNGEIKDITKANLRRKGKPYIHSSSKVGKIANQTPISERPKSINNREKIGDWEIDTVRGKKSSKSCAATFADRKSRYYIASLMPNAKADTFNRVAFKDFKEKACGAINSFTADNGLEFASHEKLTKLFNGATVYFAEPHSPWQKPTNEYHNGLLREFFPKGTSFDNVTQEELDHACNLINNRPRKVLDWLSARECFELFLH